MAAVEQPVDAAVEEVTAAVAAAVEENKKRRLELDDDDADDADGAEHSPEAKQPRIFSPDKVWNGNSCLFT